LSDVVSEKARTALREVGLTEYEIRAYLFLLQTGVTTADQVSKHANVPYSKVYEVLNSLERRGWIKTQAGRPRRYFPRSPVEALEATRLHIVSMMEAWRKSILEELQPLYDKREIREKPDIWILRGELDAINKFKEMIGNAESEIMIAAPAFTKPLWDAVLPILISLIGANVKLLIMVSRERASNLESLQKFGEVRLRENMFGGGVIADGREALLILGEKPSLIIWSDHIGLVKFAKDYFQHLWNTAEKFEAEL
jgi:sugar-specific transcriptional regulator TrmB